MYLCDYANHSTTKHWLEYLQANHEVVTDMYCNPIYAEWADVIFCEWCETSAQQLAKRAGYFTDVYDPAGILGPQNARYTGTFMWPDAKLFIRPIDIDIIYGHFNGVEWENVDGMAYIAPHLGNMLTRNKQYPPGMPIVEIPLSVKLSDWGYRDRPRGTGRQIAWVNHNWAAKNLHLAYLALHDLILRSGDKSWMLHVVSNGRSNEHWLFSYLQHLAKTLGIENNIIHYSSVPSIDEFLDDKDFLWQTSCKEGFSLIMGEAMAKGLHVYSLNWESSKHLWGETPICDTPGQLATKTLVDTYDSQFFRDLAETHSHDKEIARLREITGL